MKKVHISYLVLAGMHMVTELVRFGIALLEYMGSNYISNENKVAT